MTQRMISKKLFRAISFICFGAVIPTAQAINDDDLLPPDEAFKLTTSLEAPNILKADWVIADGYYLYRSKIKGESRTKGVSLGQPQLPAGKIKVDDYFGKTETYRHQLSASFPFEYNSTTSKELSFTITYQGCADIGVCYPPQKKQVSLPTLKPKNSNKGSLFDPIAQLTKSLGGSGFFEDELLPPDQAFPFDAELKDAQNIRLHWEIAEGYYLYRDKLKFSLENSADVSIGSFTTPSGKVKEDEYFGKVETYHGPISFDLPLIRKMAGPQEITLIAEYQGCAEKGVCYPPIKKIIPLQLPALSEAQTPAITQPIQPSTPPQQSEQEQIASELGGNSLFLTVLTFFGFGLLLALTPCIFPMIPILSGIIIGHGEKITTRHAFMISSVYVLATAITYTFFGVLAGLFGSNIQVLFQNPWVLTAFSLLFVALSLSMFGFYELQLPSSLQSRLSELSHKQKHTYIGTAIMGVLSALIVGPCIAAPLAGALIYIGQTGDALLGGLALFSMGIGSGIPLIIIGTSAGKLMPKAGPWMYAIKAFFGVSLLGVAIWLMERILPAEVTMLLWSLLFICSSVYMGATDAVKEEGSSWHKLWKGIGQLLLVAGIIMVVGAASGNKDVFQPLRGSNNGSSATVPVLPFITIHSLETLNQQIESASKQNKWVMLDFYADWCISCKEIESTFRDARVQQKLSKMLLIKADITDNSAQEKALLDYFGLIGPPAILFFAPDKLERKPFRLIGYKTADEFLAHLEKLQ
jgi:thiol:disulfide interchange protein DsbD